MGIRFPLQDVLSYNNQTIQGGGPASVAGGVVKTFTLPQDTDNVVVKLQASVVGGGVSATFQTTDDNGTTWYDVARTSIVSNANATTAEWLSIPTISDGVRSFSSIVSTGSIQTLTQSPGSAAASSLGVREVSGMPILAAYNRIFLRYTAGVSSIISEQVTVSANNESNQG